MNYRQYRQAMAEYEEQRLKTVRALDEAEREHNALMDLEITLHKQWGRFPNPELERELKAAEQEFNIPWHQGEEEQTKERPEDYYAGLGTGCWPGSETDYSWAANFDRDGMPRTQLAEEHPELIRR